MSLHIPTRRLLLLARRGADIIRDTFDGSSLDARWTKADTAGQITVSAGRVRFAGGQGSPAWGDPGIYWTRGIPHHPGLLFLIPFNASTVAFHSFNLETAGPLGDPASQLYGWTCSNPNVRTFINSTQKGEGQAVITANTDYIAMIWLGTGSCLWGISSNSGATYIPLWYEASGGNTGTLYVGYSGYSSVFTSKEYVATYTTVPQATISTTPTAPTPTLGAEAFTDPGLEGNYTAGKNDNLTIGSGTPTLAQSGDVHGGDKAQEFTAVAQYDRLHQNITLVTGTWYQVSIWAKRSAGTKAVYGRFYDGTALIDFANYTDGSTYAQSLITARAAGTGGVFRVIQDNNSSGFATHIIDDATVQPITLSSMLALAGDPGSREGLFDCHPTLTAKTQCGIAIGVDDETNPTNGIFAYHDQTNGYLVKLVNGTWTGLVATAATYSAGAKLRIQAIGTRFNLTYNGAAVGAAQTISDSSFGTKVCAFSSYASNTPGQIDIWTPITWQRRFS